MVANVDGKQKHLSAHRAVALAYLPNPESKPEVRHMNHDKTDNRLVNLKWGTTAENKQDSMNDDRLKTLPQPTRRKIAAMYATGKYTERQLAAMFGTTREIARGAIKEFADE